METARTIPFPNEPSSNTEYVVGDQFSIHLEGVECTLLEGTTLKVIIPGKENLSIKVGDGIVLKNVPKSKLEGLKIYE